MNLGARIIRLSIVLTLTILSWSCSFAVKARASDVCSAEKYKIIKLVGSFEKNQMIRNAKAVLALFTPPENSEEILMYAHWAGIDTGGITRLYSNGQTNFNQKYYKIMEGPGANNSSSCFVEVQEQRSYYPQGVGGNYGPYRPYTLYFIVVKRNRKWMVDKYFRLGDYGAHKYSGWDY